MGLAHPWLLNSGLFRFRPLLLLKEPQTQKHAASLCSALAPLAQWALRGARLLSQLSEATAFRSEQVGDRTLNVARSIKAPETCRENIVLCYCSLCCYPPPGARAGGKGAFFP